MFRQLLSSRTAFTKAVRPVSRASFRPQTVTMVRFNSSGPDLQKRVEAISEAIKTNPDLQKSIHEIKQIFESKGLTGEKPPSMFQMSMLLMDKNISTALKSFYAELQKANINFSPEDLKLLLKAYGEQNQK